MGLRSNFDGSAGLVRCYGGRETLLSSLLDSPAGSQGKETLLDPTGQLGEAHGVNRDGTAIVGAGYALGSHAYLWTTSGLTDLGILNRGPNADFDRAFAVAVSDDAKVIIGGSGFGGDSDAFLWTPSTGMLKRKDHLQAMGATNLRRWRLNSATAISADGKTIAGWRVSPRSTVESWVATLP